MTGDERDDARHEALLRQALSSYASTVQPTGDGLAKIRARTARRRLRAWLVPAIAGLAAVSVVAAVLWGAGVFAAPKADREPASTPSPTAAPTGTPTASASEPSPSGTTTVSAGPTLSLPVYYVGIERVGEGEGRLRRVLFREYHPLPTGADRASWVVSAVGAMLDGAPADPDYAYGLWPRSVRVVDAAVDEAGKSVTVDLSGVGDLASAGPPDGVSAADAATSALQQLVYTATAAAAADQTFSPTTVTVLADGQPLTALWGEPVDQPLRRATDALSNIAIESPGEGAVVSSPVTVSGLAALFETQGSWELTGPGGAVVDSGQVQTAESGKRLPFTINLGDLAPGEYTIKVFDLGGLGMPGRGPIDTKTFEVG
jgi:hypothetical protein